MYPGMEEKLVVCFESVYGRMAVYMYLKSPLTVCDWMICFQKGHKNKCPVFYNTEQYVNRVVCRSLVSHLKSFSDSNTYFYM